MKRNNSKTQPIAVKVKKGEIYAWCTCKLSKEQPFCDGSHSGTSKRPLLYKPTEDYCSKFLCLQKKDFRQAILRWKS
jgi:CDGSH-type Zn-finger protein